METVATPRPQTKISGGSPQESLPIRRHTSESVIARLDRSFCPRTTSPRSSQVSWVTRSSIRRSHSRCFSRRQPPRGFPLSRWPAFVCTCRISAGEPSRSEHLRLLSRHHRQACRVVRDDCSKVHRAARVHRSRTTRRNEARGICLHGQDDVDARARPRQLGTGAWSSDAESPRFRLRQRGVARGSRERTLAPPALRTRDKRSGAGHVKPFHTRQPGRADISSGKRNDNTASP